LLEIFLSACFAERHQNSTSIHCLYIKHFIFYQIGNALQCSQVSELLLQEYGHYMQAINYPTVPVGQEKLRLAPTPHHTKCMMDKLVRDMTDIWARLELPLYT
jgi:5-aminolevulinate synthase